MFDIISPLLSEALNKLDVKKEEISSIIDRIRGRAAPDVEIMAVRFSTAVFRRPHFFHA